MTSGAPPEWGDYEWCGARNRDGFFTFNKISGEFKKTPIQFRDQPTECLLLSILNLNFGKLKSGAVLALVMFFLTFSKKFTDPH